MEPIDEVWERALGIQGPTRAERDARADSFSSHGGLDVQVDVAGAAAAVFGPAWGLGPPTKRYLLTRGFVLPGQLPDVGFVMLNPSTADAMDDDPTIRRCRSFAGRLAVAEGRAPRVVVANLYAHRATDPGDLGATTDPAGRHNDAALLWLAAYALHLVVAWGSTRVRVRGDPSEHDAHVRRAVGLLRSRRAELLCLGTTKDGSPRHPLYVRGDAPIVPWVDPW